MRHRLDITEIENRESKIGRLHWVDSLRGLMVLLMIGYHLAFDLDFFGFAEIDVQKGGWLFLLRVIQFGFLGLVGVSLFLSRQRLPYPKFLRKQVLRALTIFALALTITLITYILYPNETIWFGVLHLIAVSVLVGALIADLPLAQGLLAFGAILGVWVLAPIPVTTKWLLPFGLTPEVFGSFDYYPLFPWVSVVLGGMLLARLLDRLSLLRDMPKLRVKPLGAVGRYSLPIYLIHQPLLFGLLWLFLRIR